MAQPEEGILADGLDSLDKAPKKKKRKKTTFDCKQISVGSRLTLRLACCR
jgi:hypothetical protein